MKSVLIAGAVVFTGSLLRGPSTFPIEPGGTLMASNMGQSDRRTDDRVDAARAAILILRTISHEGVLPNQVRLAPDDQIRSDSEAALILSQMEKPIQCTGNSDGRVLTISCEPVTHDYEWLLREQRNPPRNPVHSQGKEARSQSTIIAGREESLTLSASATELLDRDFLILGRYFVKKNSAARAGISDGNVGSIRRYLRSSSGTTVTALPEY